MNIKAAREIQLKYQFYLLGLCFTILALAVQTAKFAGPAAANAIELAGWLFLLISGLIGMFRFELVPTLYQLSGRRTWLQDAKLELQKANTEEVLIPEQNKNAKTSDLVAKIDTELAIIDADFSEQDNKIISQYRLHRWLFVAGVVALVISRGYKPAASILGC